MSELPIKHVQLLQYGALAMPLAFAGMPLYIHAPDYYATHYGVSLSLMGFILLALRFVDAIQDPLIGLLSDRFSSKRYPIMLAAAILVLFFIRDRLGAEVYTGLFLGIYFVFGAGGMWLWGKISRKYGKYHSWMWSMLMAVASFFWVFFLEFGDLWQYLVVCMVSGVAFGADLVLPPSILADYIHEGKTENSASSQFGLFAFLAKLSLALASVIVFPLLEWSGFRPGMYNPEKALLSLSFSYAIIPCLIKLFCVVIIWKTSLLRK
jgi:Na+/melibiose symporter-like transporter